MHQNSRLILLAAVCLMAVSCGNMAVLSTKGKVARKLTATAESGKYMYGHQDDLMYGHSWNSSDGKDSNAERSDVRDVCGDYPAVLGLDLGGIELGSDKNIDGNDFGRMREFARSHVRRGGIVTLSWHARNILTGGNTWDISSDKVVASCMAGGERHDEFMLWLSRAADYIESLEIPIIFRPWHEHSGSFFWWGKDLCTAEEYNTLWRMTYDYMVKVRGIRNILWAISPNEAENYPEWTERYPGDEYVDIVGFDFYDGPGVAFEEKIKPCLDFNAEFCRQHGKIPALTETGYETIRNPQWWTGMLQPCIAGYKLAYVLTWRNSYDRSSHYYGPFKGAPCEEDFVKFYNDDKTLFLNDIK